jgi:hypothetical protein
MSDAINPASVSAVQMVPRQIVNGFSSNGYTALYPHPGSPPNLPSVIANPAVTAGVLLQVLNLTGPGVLEWLGVYLNDATGRTLRMQLAIDGVTVFDSTSASLVATGTAGVVGTLGYLGGYFMIDLAEIPYKNSCQFSIASNITESMPVTVYCMRRDV